MSDTIMVLETIKLITSVKRTKTIDCDEARKNLEVAEKRRDLYVRHQVSVVCDMWKSAGLL